MGGCFCLLPGARELGIYVQGAVSVCCQELGNWEYMYGGLFLFVARS